MRGVVFWVVSLFLAGGGVRADAPSLPFKVIVNAKVTGRAIPRSVLAQIYLGKVSRWGNESAIAAVDQSSASAVRHAFSEQILGMPVEGVKNHWLRMVSTGQANQRPPLTRSTDEEVIAFVAGAPGGVGYVALTTPIPDTVREVLIQ